MLLAGILFATAIFIAIVAPKLLSQAKWQVRFPALAIWGWTTAVLAGFILVFGSFALTVIEGIKASESSSFENGIAFFLSWLGLGGVGAVFAYASTSYEHTGISQTRLSEQSSAIATSREDFDNYTLVRFESTTPIAFAIPQNRGAEIFISSEIESLLDPAQLRAVLSHEIAHIHYRHHLLLRIGILADTCTPRFLKSGTKVLSSFRLLIELVADDKAAKESGAANLANALNKISIATDNAAMRLRAERLTQRFWPVHKQVHEHHSGAHQGIRSHIHS